MYETDEKFHAALHGEDELGVVVRPQDGKKVASKAVASEERILCGDSLFPHAWVCRAGDVPDLSDALARILRQGRSCRLY